MAVATPPRSSSLGLGSFVLRRMRDGIVVLFLVVTVVFLMGYVFGDPATLMASADATPEEIARIRGLIGLDRPLPEQFLSYLQGLVTLQFGTSLWQNRPALEVVMERLPATLLLTACAIVVAGLLGAVLGVLSGANPGSWLDNIANFLAVAAMSLPSFWFGLVLILLIAVGLRLLPTSGFSSWQALILPVVALSIAHFGQIFQLVRSATYDEVSKPYVRVARSKGLSERLVLWKHVLRNAGVTVATIIGWEYARMLGGAAFAIEVVFAWPGIGNLMITAAQRQDFPVLQCAVVVAGVIVVFVNGAVDVLYRVLDPRIKVSG